MNLRNWLIAFAVLFVLNAIVWTHWYLFIGSNPLDFSWVVDLFGTAIYRR